MSGRACSLCPRSRMRAGTRHLHELEPGQAFVFEGSEAGPVYTLEATGPTSCRIRGAARRERRSFKTKWGDVVEFDNRSAGVRSCAPGALVLPVLQVGELAPLIWGRDVFSVVEGPHGPRDPNGLHMADFSPTSILPSSWPVHWSVGARSRDGEPLHNAERGVEA